MRGDSRSAVRLLAGALARNWGRVLVAVAGGTIFQLGTVVFPLCVEFAIDQGINAGDQSATVRWSLAVVGAAILLVAGLALMQWQITLAALSASNGLRGALLDKALLLDRRDRARFGRGDLAIRGTRDVDFVHHWLAGFASMITGIGGFAIILVLIGRQDGSLAVVGLATVPALVVLNIVLPKRFAAANDRLAAAHGARADTVEELLTASVAIRGIGGDGPLLARHAEHSRTVTAETMATAKVAASWAAAGPFVPGLATAVGLLVGGMAVIDGALTVGGLVAFTTWMGMLGTWVGVVTHRFTQLGEALTAAKRINEVLETKPGVADPEAGVPLSRVADLVATGVEVHAAHGRVVGPVDLTACPGEFLAVTGPLGSGKSTLLRLLARREDPDAGTVRHGDVDLRRAALSDVRARLVFVPQRPDLISGTIRENLMLGRPELTEEDLRAACVAAAIDDHVSSLPDGYDTETGESGATLSGGQLQRLALAQALLHGADVLLLDDITSAVDAETERRVLAGLRDWMNDERTIVFASHRAAVVDAADRVVALEAAAPAVREVAPSA
ncbi:ABC transporter ATP-binding protein [Amycolatopsis sp. NPDC089917]|uniref:ABC transporter ATP-binding protein n=1 Tax=Amycolatopsis sp. NPDC089917 TaxID=3155187 RepID=UPI003415DA3B